MSEIDPARLEGDMIPQGEYRPASELKELHEGTDLNIKAVLINMGVLILLFFAAFAIIAVVMSRFKDKEIERDKVALSNRFNADPTPPGPVLQADPAGETRAILDAARSRLDSYGWNDAEKTSAHIPIDRAMAILAERGLPDVGRVDQFHPKPGSSGLPKIGVPGQPAAPAAEEPKTDGAKADEPKTEETKTEEPKSEAKP